jgi:hypothetical protein
VKTTPKVIAWGACAALGIGVGWLLGASAAPEPPHWLPPIEVRASATQANDNFVVATGLVDQGIEALFFLDFLTGDLKATIVNERRPGFSAMYQYNIAADFAGAGVKNPKYLMVPGEARNLRNVGGGGNQLAMSVLYVVEATTGQLGVYGIPWNPSMHASGKPQFGTFIPLARTALRNEFVRDQ